jgi:hypothetical protein
MFGITIPLKKLPNLWILTLRFAPCASAPPLAALAWAIILPFRSS